MRLSSLLVCVLVLFVVSVSSGQAQRREPGEAKERGEAKEPGEAKKPGEREKDADDDKGPGDAGPAMGLGAGMAGAVHPLMQALDADGDGVISAKEIKSAAKALKSLDANHDGKLTQDELLPGRAPAMPGAGAGAGAQVARAEPAESDVAVRAEQVEQDWAGPVDLVGPVALAEAVVAQSVARAVSPNRRPASSWDSTRTGTGD